MTNEDELQQKNKREKVYISGQITGLEKTAYMALFGKVEKILEHEGYEAVSPVRFTEFENPESMEWQDFMRRDIKLLCNCDCIFLLPNWMESKGARLEATIAEALGIPCINLRERTCKNCCSGTFKKEELKSWCVKVGKYVFADDSCKEWDY